MPGPMHISPVVYAYPVASHSHMAMYTLIYLLLTVMIYIRIVSSLVDVPMPPCIWIPNILVAYGC